jgi:hypothetical protein
MSADVQIEVTRAAIAVDHQHAFLPLHPQPADLLLQGSDGDTPAVRIVYRTETFTFKVGFTLPFPPFRCSNLR